MVSRGYTAVSVGKDHEDAYHKPPVYNYELHTRLFDPETVYAYDYYRNITERCKRQGYLYTMTDEDFYLYFLAHAYKHYSSGGIGLRYLVDCWVFLRAKGAALNRDYINRELDRLGLTAFEQESRSLSEKLMAVPGGELTRQEEEEDGEEPPVPEKPAKKRGGRNGVFFAPRVIASKHHRALFIVEGFTDTLAMAAIGLPVIGRASCLTGADEIATIVRSAAPACVYIIADNDDTHFAAGRAYMPGRRGADELAKRLTRPAAILFLGNHKDARDFITARLTAGMSAEAIAYEIQRLAEEATPRARALRPRITPARVFLGKVSSSSNPTTPTKE